MSERLPWSLKETMTMSQITWHKGNGHDDIPDQPGDWHAKDGDTVIATAHRTSVSSGYWGHYRGYIYGKMHRDHSLHDFRCEVQARYDARKNADHAALWAAYADACSRVLDTEAALAKAREEHDQALQAQHVARQAWQDAGSVRPAE
jgi:hypothetical protein